MDQTVRAARLAMPKTQPQSRDGDENGEGDEEGDEHGSGSGSRGRRNSSRGKARSNGGKGAEKKSGKGSGNKNGTRKKGGGTGSSSRSSNSDGHDGKADGAASALKVGRLNAEKIFHRPSFVKLKEGFMLATPGVAYDGVHTRAFDLKHALGRSMDDSDVDNIKKDRLAYGMCIWMPSWMD